MRASNTSAFDSDEDYIFGVDLSKLDLSEIADEVDASSSCNKDATVAVVSPVYSIRVDALLSSKNFGKPHSSTDMDYENLFTWAIEAGALLDGITCKDDSYGGMGLFATNELIEGEVAAILPRALRIGQNCACQRLGLPNSTPDLSALSLFLLDLVLSDDENGSFHHYAACLPKRCSNALFMSAHEIQYYEKFGEEYSTAIEAVRSQEISCYEYIRDVLASTDFEHSNTSSNGLKWAIAMVQSRTHGFGTQRSRWLTPIFDFANHSTTPNCKLEGDAQGQLLLRAVQCIAPGSPITIDYQVTEDAKLVATYGFSLKYKPYQAVGCQ
eukprot:scaffold26019_cov147-Cylindrotheca_fusiformis.AAC.2